jgi:hypothetical protein
MSNEYDNTEENYTNTGWGALDDVQRGSAGLAWLDFRQGRGDTADLRLLEIKGVRQKQFKSDPPYQVLEMKIEVHSRNGQPCAPTEHMTNPKSAWCINIKKTINEIAKKHGWDGAPQSLGQYAEHVPSYLMKWTRNDDPKSRMGNIDVEIIRNINEEETPFDAPQDELLNKLHAANNLGQLDDAMRAHFKGLDDAAQAEARKLYVNRKAALDIDIGW